MNNRNRNNIKNGCLVAINNDKLTINWGIKLPEEVYLTHIDEPFVASTTNVVNISGTSSLTHFCSTVTHICISRFKLCVNEW